MKGIPEILQTRNDWLQAVAYVISKGGGKAELSDRLRSLKNTKTRLVLKQSSKGKAPEDQGAKDFEAENDPSSAFVLSGLSDEDIESMILRMEV